MPEFNLLKTYPKGKRNIKLRHSSKTKKIIKISKQFGKQYFDGARIYGYGGYIYIDMMEDGSKLLNQL